MESKSLLNINRQPGEGNFFIADYWTINYQFLSLYHLKQLSRMKELFQNESAASAHLVYSPHPANYGSWNQLICIFSFIFYSAVTFYNAFIV
jgi:hypothetical protein